MLSPLLGGFVLRTSAIIHTPGGEYENVWLIFHRDLLFGEIENNKQWSSIIGFTARQTTMRIMIIINGW